MGKFKSDMSHPRPLLVNFLRTFDANIILANQNQIKSPIIIKPDMSLEERKCESMLLHERWDLIQQEIDRKSIKIHNKQLFVDDQLHGRIINSKYVISAFPNKQIVNDDIVSPVNDDTPAQIEHQTTAQ